jgi:signal transduction histidine kinase/DNA-binding response OmpR family regulator/HAMP domain-containing protein
MKLRDMKIGARLYFGFGMILIFVALGGALAYVQANRLWQSTDDLYNHPLQIAQATRDFKSDVVEIRHTIRDMIFAENDDEIQSSILKFNNKEKDINNCFTIAYDRYLGDKADIDSVNNAYQDWILYCKETIRLYLNGQVKVADERTRPGTLGDSKTERMILLIQRMIDFSKARANKFYTNATEVKDNLNNHLIIIFISILFLSSLLAYIITRGMRKPILSLAEVAREFASKKYSVRSSYKSTNEVGTLAGTFNSLAETIENEVVTKDNIAWMSDLMMREDELEPFCRNLINALLEKTGSNIAVVYLLDRKKQLFEPYASSGLSEVNLKSFPAGKLEGEFAAALVQKKIIRITDIPHDTPFTFNAVSGTFRPKEIITIPVIDNDEVISVISLSGLNKYSESAVNLINEIWVTVTARMLGVLNYQKISDFSSLLDIQNQELEQKSKELIMQADELKEYNIELELQKRQLDEVNKLKSTFLSNMSHELRTPLNSVIALSGVLSRRLAGKISEDEFSYLNIIEKNGKNLLILINDILDLSRIEAGREEINFSKFSIGELVRDILNSLEPIIEERGISACCLIDVEMPAIISDKAKCHHILQNLISNAVKFTEKGFVEISAFVDKDKLFIDVKDTGIGIQEDFLPFIFDEFRQADDLTSRKYSGTGLGLAIVKKYCHLLNGSVEVKSKFNEGSVFTVILPLRPNGLLSSEDVGELQVIKGKDFHTDNNKGNLTKGRTLLLVEDSEPQIVQITDILNEEGYIIHVACNGKEALDIIHKSIPDAMILDLQMPEVDGFEVLREIRKHKETRSIPVLILTAKHISRAELSFLKENHISQLIQKGAVNKHDLLAQIKNIMMQKDEDEPVKPKAILTGHQTGARASILVIEDNPDSLVTLKALLEDNYIIISASDGAEGLMKAAMMKPDLILLDISLPGMDGFKVLDKLKINEQLSHIPVVALTARAMKGDREDLLAYGFDGYIAKPVDNDTFEATINEYLNSKN